jgi:hypothetical protein
VRRAAVRLRHVDDDVADAAQLRDRLLRLLARDRLAVPALLVLDGRVALALERPGDDGGRLLRLRSLAIRAVDLLDVVAVDLEHAPPERLEPARVGGEVPAVHRLAPLTEAIHVDDRRQVVELVEGGVLDRLPHRALGHLAVAADHPDAERKPVEALAGERHPDADRQPLPERAGRDVDPRQHRHRVPLQAAAELAVGHELLFADHACRAEESVDERRGVPLREVEAVVARIVRVVEVIAEVRREQHRRQVGGRHRGGRVAGLRMRARAHRVDPQLLAEFAPELRAVHPG